MGTNETKETDFNSTLLDDGTIFSSHTKNFSSPIGFQNNNNINNNNNKYENYRNQRPINSTEITQSPNQLNTTHTTTKRKYAIISFTKTKFITL